MRTKWAAALGAAMLAVGGCEESRTPSPSGEIARLAFVVRSARDPATEIVRAGAAAFEARRPRVRVDVIVPEAASPEGQQRSLEALQESAYQAACVWPIEPGAVRGILTRMTTRGLPVITLGRDVAESGRAGHCGPDAREAGRALARACVRAAAKRVEATTRSAAARGVGVVHTASRDEESAARLAGFREEMDLFPELAVVRAVDCGGRELEAGRLLRDEIKKYPRMAAWVLTEDWALHGVPVDRTIDPAGPALVVYSHTLTHLERLRAGTVDAVVLCDWRAVVDQSLSAAEDVMRGTRLPVERQLFEALVVTRDDLPEFEQRWRTWVAGAETRPAPGAAGE